MDGSRVAIGVDLGATKVQVAVLNDRGTVLAQRRAKTESSRRPEAVREQLMDLVRGTLRCLGTPVIPLGIGVGVAGQVDALTGTVLFGPNLGWRDVPLGRWLKEELRIEVFVTNDVRAATFGEWRFGAGQGRRDLVCLFIGTGIGGGIVAGGRLIVGANNCAGELGHMVVSLDGPLCGCGARGCLEALAGGKYLALEAKRRIQDDPGAGVRLLGLAGGDPEAITMELIVRAHFERDELSCRIIKGMKEALAAGIASIVHAFNPSLIILGGGIVEGLPGLVGELEVMVRSRVMEASSRGLSLAKAKLGALSGAIGAGAMILEGWHNSIE